MEPAVLNKTVVIKRPTIPSIFKMVAIGTFISMTLFAVLMGLFGYLFDTATIRWNRQAIGGLKGLLLSPFVGLFLSAIFTLFIGSGLAIGMWLYGCVGKMKLNLLVYEEDDSSASTVASVSDGGVATQ